MSAGIYFIVYTAGALGFITSLPQLYQIIKTKKVRDLNPLFFILHFKSDLLYMTYGILTNDYLLVYSLTMPVFCNFLIFILYFVYKNNNIEEDSILVNDNE